MTADEYFAETYDENDEDFERTPLSQFARDQRVKWYDHDFLEYGFNDRAASVEELVAGHSYSDQWGAELARRAAEARLSGINWFAFITESEIAEPKSVRGDGYWVEYLGTISYRI
jgi:hypothetical protein